MTLSPAEPIREPQGSEDLPIGGDMAAMLANRSLLETPPTPPTGTLSAEMIEAGVAAWQQWADGPDENEDECVRAIYLAMLAVAPKAEPFVVTGETVAKCFYPKLDWRGRALERVTELEAELAALKARRQGEQG